MQVTVNVCGICMPSYDLQEHLLSPTFKQVGLMWLHAQATIFTADRYGYVFMVTMNAWQLDLLQVVPTDCAMWACIMALKTFEFYSN